MVDTKSFPKGSLILVTGMTGTLGGSVVKELLKAGYRVSAPVRNLDKARKIAEVLKQYGPENLSLVEINDMDRRGAFDEAIKGCVGVVHVANDSSLSPNPNEVIPAALERVNNLLRAAMETASVKRFVYTSSEAVMPSIAEPGKITGSSWRPNADGIIKFAWAEPYTANKGGSVYVATKILCERACWDFVEREKPAFSLNTVMPGFLIGEVLVPELISSSNKLIHGLMRNDPHAVGFLSTISPSNFVDVEDAAQLHVCAVSMNGLENQRLLAYGEPFDLNRTVETLKAIVPEGNFPPKLDVAQVVAEVDTSQEIALLKTFGKDGFRGFEDSVRLCIETGSLVA